mgnify:CR=1
NGVSFQRSVNKINRSYDNFKTYLIADIWLLKISEGKLKPLLIAINEVLKLFVILIFNYLSQFIKLFLKFVLMIK